ncbi:hypothetical protein UK82_15940 [Frankia sp. ACN1ag]|nr:hypothetical protein UK82_15940 [Frankia sp. ACN1ag]
MATVAVVGVAVIGVAVIGVAVVGDAVVGDDPDGSEHRRPVDGLSSEHGSPLSPEPRRPPNVPMAAPKR